MRKNKKKRFSKNEFRYNYNTKHINYVFEEESNKYHSLGITHRKYTFGKKNILLDKNPQKNKIDKSYLRNGIITSKKNNYSSVRKNFNFSESDMPKVRAKIRKYKNNRRKYK